jgi:hypothetical protein
MGNTIQGLMARLPLLQHLTAANATSPDKPPLSARAVLDATNPFYSSEWTTKLFDDLQSLRQPPSPTLLGASNLVPKTHENDDCAVPAPPTRPARKPQPPSLPTLPLSNSHGVPNGDYALLVGTPALRPAIGPQGLELDKITPEMIEAMSDDQIKLLMQLLDRSDQSMQPSLGGIFPAMRRNVGTDFAQAMYARCQAKGDFKAFDRVAKALSPQQRQHLLASADNPNELGMAFRMSRSDKDSTCQHAIPSNAERAQLIGMVRNYLARNGGSDPKKCAACVQDIVKSLDGAVEKTPEGMGILMGCILAGLMQHLSSLGKSAGDTKDLLVNITSAVCAGLEAFPATAAAGMFFGFLSAGLNQGMKPSDNNELARQVEGSVKDAWLNHNPYGWRGRDSSRACDELGMVLNQNGYAA